MLKFGMNCFICDRINLAKNGKNPELVIKLKTGFVFLINSKYYPGYTIFSCLKHKNEIFDLPNDFKKQFLLEMSVVAEAVNKVFSPKKINYELLGNLDSHLHWHIIPRYKNDPNITKSVWGDYIKVKSLKKEPPSKQKISELKKEVESILKKT